MGAEQTTTIRVEHQVSERDRAPRVELVLDEAKVHLQPLLALEVARQLTREAYRALAAAAAIEQAGGERLTTREAADAMRRYSPARERVERRARMDH